jgi:hypothetical protein
LRRRRRILVLDVVPFEEEAEVAVRAVRDVYNDDDGMLDRRAGGRGLPHRLRHG